MVDKVIVKEMGLEVMITEAEVVLDGDCVTCYTKEWMLERMRQHCLQVRRLMILTESV
jgi:hypothetical protein